MIDSQSIEMVSRVQDFSGVASPNLIEQLRPDGSDSKPNGLKADRIDLIGLPGLGKSTLIRYLFAKYSSLRLPVFAIPEAADYAITKMGYTLHNMEGFLSGFYDDAEELATTATRRVPKLIVLREPAGVQNSAYLVMQRPVREVSLLITELEREYRERGEWRHELERRLWSETKDPILETLADGGPWVRHFVVLTTRCPEEDLELSGKRQLGPGRDPRLATLDHFRLCAYLAAIRGIAEHLRRMGFAVMQSHPATPMEEIVSEIIAAWAHCRQA
jgi:hypothetical protein